MQYAYSYQTIPNPPANKAYDALERRIGEVRTPDEAVDLLVSVVGEQRGLELLIATLTGVNESGSYLDTIKVDAWYERITERGVL